MVLYGQNGAGKSRLAKAVNNWVSKVGHAKQFIVKANEIQSLQSIYWAWPELLDAFKEGRWNLIDDLARVPVLILDELGGDHDPSQVGVEKLTQILSRREKKWTIVTTNFSEAEWESKFDRRITSRFFRNSELIDFSNVPDFHAP